IAVAIVYGDLPCMSHEIRNVPHLNLMEYGLLSRGAGQTLHARIAIRGCVQHLGKELAAGESLPAAGREVGLVGLLGMVLPRWWAIQKRLRRAISLRATHKRLRRAIQILGIILPLRKRLRLLRNLRPSLRWLRNLRSELRSLRGILRRAV